MSKPKNQGLGRIRGGMIVLQKYAGLVALAMCVLAAGCISKEQTNTQGTTSTVSDANRPPLRIGLISQPDGLEEIIKTRWASVSEQKLEFVALHEQDVGNTEAAKMDVLVAPAYLLGTMVEEKWVSKLPDELVEKELTGQSESDSKVNAFPPHWLSLAQYGRVYYGVPFGATLLLAGTPADQNATAKQSSGQERKNSFLPTIALDWSKYRLAVPKESNPLSTDIVAHYLVIASSRRPDIYDASPLFKLLDGSSRLGESWAIQSAEILRELYRAQGDDRTPIVFGWDPTQNESGLSWQVPTIKRNREVEGSESNGSSGDQSQQTGDWNILTDLTHAPLFLLSATTRQSSKSTFFLNWICEPSQRSALAKVWPCSFPIAEGASLPNGFRDVAYRASNADDIPTFFKLRHGLRYRDLIHTALKKIIDDPAADVANVMLDCSLECDKITESLGRDFQQDSLERSLNLK